MRNMYGEDDNMKIVVERKMAAQVQRCRSSHLQCRVNKASCSAGNNHNSDQKSRLSLRLLPN